MQLGLDTLPTYGIMHGIDRTQIREYIDFLVDKGYLLLTEDEYPVLRTTDKAKEVLFRGEKVVYASKKPAAQKSSPGRKRSDAAPAQPEPVLLDSLKALRTRLAQQEQVPAYIVFSNASLADMAARQPQTLEEFLQVSGVGMVKAQRYGEAFLEEIRRWKADE